MAAPAETPMAAVMISTVLQPVKEMTMIHTEGETQARKNILQVYFDRLKFTDYAH